MKKKAFRYAALAMALNRIVFVSSRMTPMAAMIPYDFFDDPGLANAAGSWPRFASPTAIRMKLNNVALIAEAVARSAAIATIAVLALSLRLW